MGSESISVKMSYTIILSPSEKDSKRLLVAAISACMLISETFGDSVSVFSHAVVRISAAKIMYMILAFMFMIIALRNSGTHPSGQAGVG